MEEISRRSFLRKGGDATAALALAAVGTTRTAAATEHHNPEELEQRAAGQYAILFDSTLCIGCRSCEIACSTEHQLERSTAEIFQGCPFEDARALSPDVFTCVTRHSTEGDPSTMAFGKVQCMHCIEPACVSSCPVEAMEKTAEGAVIWHADLCLGCRYCVLVCPFLVPSFEWHSRNPRIRKCDMCYHRLKDGREPVCVAACPSGALKLGRREQLLKEAHRRITELPRNYVHHVYGEHEAGGTSVLHLARGPFEELGYRTDLPTSSYRNYTRPAMAVIPYIMNGLALVLGMMVWLVGRRRQVFAVREGRER